MKAAAKLATVATEAAAATAAGADILARILDAKAAHVARCKAARPVDELRAAIAQRESAGDSPRGFAAAIARDLAAGRAAVIAEIKRASPSRGVIRADFDAARLARDYADHGATALSVLTDSGFFQGRNRHLVEARAACALPVLRKDFVIDAYQLFESRALGADAVLLIAAALDDSRLHRLAELAAELQLDALVEVHDAAELARALPLPAKLIGINNRNLRTFETRLDTTLELLDAVPDDRIVVTESGIAARADVARMRAAGVHAFLVGESLMRAPRPGEKLQELFER